MKDTTVNCCCVTLPGACWRFWCVTIPKECETHHCQWAGSGWGPTLLALSSGTGATRQGDKPPPLSNHCKETRCCISNYDMTQYGNDILIIKHLWTPALKSHEIEPDWQVIKKKGCLICWHVTTQQTQEVLIVSSLAQSRHPDSHHRDLSEVLTGRHHT